ncbi:diamine N-acetyltransferase [Streptoalloteichus tenebrarius]|uniref:Diamine N-acetyltransferase n=1 Tax=Streptoalloteichus tenebrarius (strain ATCC 17920 / DSM 40477 / JCM 4838 / CBS 697.72 / NBRC 16177 / NCIMB 11028 / NRRL B-12390 / A12253. 1 / ISP 5477) TaxID=1933 RepID=A0ABT1HM34_STRSD|nr:GNAT family N-acetyltransferase [Streptoalloteichus tenebrarius]MCP2256554.1 diamine N-acetyltransferase [Streptoalloteichus tenebrarius]BFF04908.1 GNAT family N-acetyltransferase [Streptoalloteichus tenebrarius]
MTTEPATTPTVTRDSELTFRRISALNVCEVCELSETLSEQQRGMVADNGTSIAEGFCSTNAWFRAIYADETPVGFVMLHFGSDWDDGIECHGAYLWRLMIGGPFQGMGFGRRAVEFVVREVRARGYRELFTSYGEGEGSPEPFYSSLGFVRTGDHYGDEPEAVLVFEKAGPERAAEVSPHRT